MTLHIEQSGHGPDIVFLHGWGMHSGIWQTLISSLDGFRITRIDLPGHGHSQQADQTDQTNQFNKPIDFNLSNIAKQVMATLPPQSLLVGWSLGGLVAQYIAAQPSNSLQGLLLIASTPAFSHKTDWQHAMDNDTLELFAQQLGSNPSGTLQRFLALQVRGCNDQRSLLKTLRQAIAARPTAQTAALNAGLEMLQHDDLREILDQIRCPTHWVFGQHDKLVPETVSKDIAALMPDSENTILKGAGHAPFLSHPEHIVSLIRQMHYE